MQAFLEEWEPPTEITSDTTTWEWLKQEIKTFTKRFMKTQRNEETNLLRELEKKLLLLVEKRDEGQPDLDFPIDSLVRQIKEIEESRARRVIFKSPTKYEKPTKYFLNLQKRKRKESVLSPLITQEGQTITDHGEILREGRKFYENLFESKENDQTALSDIEEEIQDLNLPQLSPEGRLALDAPLTLDELRAAVWKMGNQWKAFLWSKE